MSIDDIMRKLFLWTMGEVLLLAMHVMEGSFLWDRDGHHHIVSLFLPEILAPSRKLESLAGILMLIFSETLPHTGESPYC